MTDAEQVARAAHEIRGAATALALVCEALRRDPAARHHGAAIGAQLDRLRAGLADLEAARTGRVATPTPEAVELSSLTRAAMEFAWVGGPVPARLDRGRFAQALGNMLANAAEHGAGDVRVVGRTHGGRVSVEVSNSVARAAGERGRAAEGDGAAERGRAAEGESAAEVGGAAERGGAAEGESAAEVGGATERGRGLLIASRAAEELGGRLSFEILGGSAVATLDLPDG